jgi:hypothetical protein
VPLGPVDPHLGIDRLQCLRAGDWHLPFVHEKDIREAQQLEHALEALKKISTARCARVSYFLPENGQRSDMGRDLELCDRLAASGHWSPFEHVATPVEQDGYIGNFWSWKQYRKDFPQEHGGDRGI